MKHETIKLKPENEAITLTTYLSDVYEGDNMPPRPAMIVAPGGAYWWWADQREGEPIVKEFFAKGFNCFLLHYSVMPHAAFPTPLQDMSRAIIYVREHAQELNVDPDRIFVCGFSAGGHLCASIGTMWDKDFAKPYDDMPFGLNKPNGMILCYPWITLEEPHRHFDCANNICSGEITDEKIQMYAPDKNVSENTCPAYIWTTCFDDCVDVENSIMMAAALSAKKIPYELHIFQNGPHGLGLANKETWCGLDYLNQPDAATWIEEAIYWAKNLKK